MNTQDWTQRLLPLPQEIAVDGSRSLRADQIDVRVHGDAPQLLQGERILREAMGSRPTSGTRLTIHVGTHADFADLQPLQDLAKLPNAEQSYQILTISPEQIVISGHTAVGALYGAMTMAQLLSGKRGTRIEVPFVHIVDWPDMEQRGMWNFGDAETWIPWMSAMKLNYGKMAETRLSPVRRGRRNSATIEADLMQTARNLGFEYLPFIVHLNFLHDTGLFRAYPELAGHGDEALAGRYFAHKSGNQHRAPCASQPRLVSVLGEWLDSMARQGADEISCWLSERPCQCQCEQCTPTGQFLLETRAFVAAWENQLKDHPTLRIRIFSSTTTAEQDDLILAELPAGVRFERACASGMERIRHQPRDLFANPLLDSAARDGRWIASYDVPIGAYGNVDTPEVKVPQFSAQRIRDYVSQLHARSYAGAYGMLAWGSQAKEICGFAISALAEYCWNGKGRSVEDFATAWAAREGLQRADRVGQWAQILGEVEFDIYDDGFSTHYTWGVLAQRFDAATPPTFGEGIFRHFHCEQDFDTKRALCRQARALLNPHSHEPLVLATDVVSSYVELAAAIWHTTHAHAHGDMGSPAGQTQLAAAALILERAGQANVDAISTWRRHLGQEPWMHRVHDAIQATRDTVQRMLSHIRDQHSDLI